MKLVSIFSQRVQTIFDFIKDTNKRARNMKHASIFFALSESIFQFCCSALVSF